MIKANLSLVWRRSDVWWYANRPRIETRFRYVQSNTRRFNESKTYFLLVTDGVANTRLDGYLHKTNTNDSINEYPDPRHPLQVSVEYSNDYQVQQQKF